MARPKKLSEVDQPETEQPDTLQQQPETQPEPETQQSTVRVRPIHGPMHHLFQNVRIDGITELEMDNWLEVQIAAGKLEIV